MNDQHQTNTEAPGGSGLSDELCALKPDHFYNAEVGDYVLASKYDDGDPCDHFFVGFVSGYTSRNRYLIVDNDGNSQRAGGFKRVEKITANEGRELVNLMPFIGDKQGPSVWWHLSNMRGDTGDRFCDVCKYELDNGCQCNDDA